MLSRLRSLYEQMARALDAVAPAFNLATRCYVGWQFFKSGMLKLGAWETTLYLFEHEYRVPLLPAGLAAVLGTAGELLFPLLLALGIASRLAAAGLQAVNVMAVVAYAHVLLAAGSEAALGAHVLWGYMLLIPLFYGGGTLSVDRLLRR